MGYQMKDGQGAMFINDAKDKPTQPDKTGKIRWKGETLRVACWWKAPNEKRKTGYWSMAVQTEDEWNARKEGHDRRQPNHSTPPAQDDFNDEIPF